MTAEVVAILGAAWVMSNRPFTSWREAAALLLLGSVVPGAVAAILMNG